MKWCKVSSFLSLLYINKCEFTSLYITGIFYEWVSIYFNRRIHIWLTTQWVLKEECEPLVRGSISLLQIHLKIKVKLSAQSDIRRKKLFLKCLIFFYWFNRCFLLLVIKKCLELIFVCPFSIVMYCVAHIIDIRKIVSVYDIQNP